MASARTASAGAISLGGDGSRYALVPPAVLVTADFAALQADVDSLTSELLMRYEELTLLYDLARDLGVVVDVAGAAANALSRSLKVIPAKFAAVFVGDDPLSLRVVAVRGDRGEGSGRLDLAQEFARSAATAATSVLAQAGDPALGLDFPLAEPVLACPLTGAGSATGARPLGTLVYVGHEGDCRFSAAEAQLGAVVGGQLAQGMENARVITQLREKERLESDLNAAAAIQRLLLPRYAPVVVGGSLSAECLPATKVGGDYYDYFPASDGVINLLVADVTGHGMGPGLIMAMTRSVLRAELRRMDSLVESLAATNAVMWDDLVATEIFITAFAARYDQRTRQLRYVNAGHQPALLRRRDGSVVELTSEGMPLGILETPEYEERVVQLENGDTVLVFSDGVVEAVAPDGTSLGSPRLQERMAAAAIAEHSADDVVSTVLDLVSRFRDTEVQDDDITVVALHLADDVLGCRAG